jgi:hypothetical protein
MKTPNQAQTMLETIQEDLRKLPKENVFGDSNDEERATLQTWTDELVLFINTGRLPQEKGEVYLWITSEAFSALQDFE